MTTIVVLFNLKAGVSRDDYEAWAKNTDLATVRKLDSISAFDVYRANGVLGSDDPSPYEYIEIIQVNDMEKFGADVATDTMTKVAGEFQAVADNPTFIMTETIEG